MKAALLLLSAVLAAPAAAQPRRNVLETLGEALAQDAAYDAAERRRLLDAIRERFADYGVQIVDDKRRAAIPVVLHVITEGSFDEAPPERVADVAFAAYQAVSRGAPAEVVEGIALYGYRKRVPGERIALWANGYRQMTDNRVPADVAADLVRLAMDMDVPDSEFDILKWALVDGAKRGFDQKAYATWLLGNFAQGRGRPGRLAGEAKDLFLQARRSGRKPELPAYEGVFAPKAPAPAPLSEPEPPAPAADKPVAEPSKPALPPAAPAKPVRPAEPAPPAGRLAQLWPALDSVSRAYLGTPYVWGGNTHAGIDCSGLTRNTYGENRVSIPRVSRDQYKTGRPVDDGPRPGDLVFFNTLGVGVSHVGMLVDPKTGTFIHASSSKGVSYAQLDKKYYKQRYLGARRVIP